VGDRSQIHALGVVKWCTAQSLAKPPLLPKGNAAVPSDPADVPNENKPSEKTERSIKKTNPRRASLTPGKRKFPSLPYTDTRRASAAPVTTRAKHSYTHTYTCNPQHERKITHRTFPGSTLLTILPRYSHGVRGLAGVPRRLDRRAAAAGLSVAGLPLLGDYADPAACLCFRFSTLLLVPAHRPKLCYSESACLGN
jgi:hypothetical protein